MTRQICFSPTCSSVNNFDNKTSSGSGTGLIPHTYREEGDHHSLDTKLDTVRIIGSKAVIGDQFLGLYSGWRKSYIILK